MNKYNNKTTKRFNNRPRYGANDSGYNSKPRYKHQNQSGYQYSNNRNNTPDSYLYNEYEKNARHFYGISPKRPNLNQHQNNKQSDPYSHKSAALSLSPSSSSFSAATQNILNLSSTQPTLSPQLASQNNQQQCNSSTLDNSNCYGFSYNNYYPSSYSADLIATTTNQTFGVASGYSSYLWETLKSTPPPKLPQPPLPEQEPPPILPPLPSDDKSPHLPSRPNPASTLDPSSLNPAKVDQEHNKPNDSASKTVVKIKAKRKAMSARYKLNKNWSEEDSLFALKAEQTNARKIQTDILILRFPDPEINRETVKCYSPDIESVHFQLNFAPRYCLVHLKPGTDVEKTIDNLSKIPFGTGFLSVEIKQITNKVHSTKLNEIDPYTLYVGNLPTTIACKTLKEHFPGAARIDIGFAQRMKYTRYAFIRYQNVNEAIEAYKRMLDAEIGGRRLSIRFRRLTPSSEVNKDGENPDDMHDGLLIQTTATSKNNSTLLPQNCGKNPRSIHSLQKQTLEDIGNNSNDASKNTTDFVNNTAVSDIQAKAIDTVESQISSKEPLFSTDHNSAKTSSTDENRATEMNYFRGTTSSTENISTTLDNFNTPILNVKPDPDIDPNDIIVRDKAIPTRSEGTSDTIKQEEQSAIYDEFFAPPNNHNDSSKANTVNDTISLNSTNDETETMSTLSINSLGEFLETCQRPQTQANCSKVLGPPPTKRNKTSGNVLHDTIKKEPLENGKIVTGEIFETVKQELVQDNKNSKDIANNTPLSDSANKTVSRRIETARAATSAIQGNSTNPQSNIKTNDDIVPATALFFRTQNTMANSINDCDYDEFYDTRINEPSQANIKKEPLDISISASINKNGQNVQQKDERVASKHKHNSSISVNTTTIPNAIDEDDLVPAHNLLGSYRPLRSEIKQEIEHDDIFSVPINNSNILNVDSNLNNRWNNIESVTNMCSQSDKRGQVIDGFKSNGSSKDNDEDVIIVSDNISRRPQLTNYNTSTLSNLFFHRHTDLVTIKSKPIAVTIPRREVSKLLHRDNLDKLYEQLDADSDSDL